MDVAVHRILDWQSIFERNLRENWVSPVMIRRLRTVVVMEMMLRLAHVGIMRKAVMIMDAVRRMLLPRRIIAVNRSQRRRIAVGRSQKKMRCMELWMRSHWSKSKWRRNVETDVAHPNHETCTCYKRYKLIDIMFCFIQESFLIFSS